MPGPFILHLQHQNFPGIYKPAARDYARLCIKAMVYGAGRAFILLRNDFYGACILVHQFDDGLAGGAISRACVDPAPLCLCAWGFATRGGAGTASQLARAVAERWLGMGIAGSAGPVCIPL